MSEISGAFPCVPAENLFKGKEMKLELITINDLTNYGNRLQNYATQNFLQKKGFQVENIVDESYYPMQESHESKLWQIARHTKHMVRAVCRGTLKRDRIVYKRKKNFLTFNQNITYSGIAVKTTEELKKCGIEDKVVLVGSDQVWNPEFALSDITLLYGVRCKKKIAFSASFGVSSIAPENRIKTSLMDFDALSVREDTGAAIIRKLTGRDAEILIDPTLLLTQDEWREVSRKPEGAVGSYILTYFLSPKCDAANKKLAEIRQGRKVYELLDAEDRVAGTAGPAEFLWLFDHADLILTDSFHACVFSFLFDKPFVVYDRNWAEVNMNSRLETLLKKFHLERKYANAGLENDLWEHDYTEGYQQLEIERQKANDFLKKTLEG